MVNITISKHTVHRKGVVSKLHWFEYDFQNACVCILYDVLILSQKAPLKSSCTYFQFVGFKT